MRKRFRRKQGNGVFRNRIYSQSLRKTELQFVRWIEPRGAEPAALHPFRTVVTTRLCPRGRRTNTGMGFPDIREKSLVVSIIYICRFSGGSSRRILCRAEKGTAGSFTDFQYPLFRVGRSVCGHLAAAVLPDLSPGKNHGSMFFPSASSSSAFKYSSILLPSTFLYSEK